MISAFSPAHSSLGTFLWLAASMGVMALLTPCVFPMVPITVSYFANSSARSRFVAVRMALFYGLGIVLTFVALGMLLTVILGASGVNRLATNPWVNLSIACMFLGFALSLMGAWSIHVPHRLVDRLDRITRSHEGSRIFGALLMGCTFSLTSFTCTAPFVGTLLVMTSQGNWMWPLLGMLAYAGTFSLPFVVLALVPQFVSQLPRAGGWMNSTKAVLGFLEIGAAMKFVANADLVWHWGIFTRQTVLGIWIAIGVLVVAYLLGLFRFPHDSLVERIGVVRLGIAGIFLASTIILVPGLLGHSLGEMDSFLPQSNALPALTRTEGSTLDSSWIVNDYEKAKALSRLQNKPLFIDFTGYTCTNCRWMEANLFPRPEVQSRLGKLVPLKLYTDGNGEVFDRQQKMEEEIFGTVALPYYAVVSPNGSVRATFAGLTRNSEEFARFMDRGLQ